MSFLKKLSKAAEKLGEVAGRTAADAYELVVKVEDKLDEVVATIDRGIEAGLKSSYDKRHGKTASQVFDSPASTTDAASVQKQYERLLGDDVFVDILVEPAAEEKNSGVALQEGVATDDAGLKATANKAAAKPSVKKPAVKKAPAKKTAPRPK